MPCCVISKCNNYTSKVSKTKGGVSFFRFPADELLQHEWLIVVREQRQEPCWMPNKHSRICSMHFKCQDMHTTNKGYKKLSKSAVPFSQAEKVAGNYTPPRPTSPNSLNSENISDLESVFESRRIAFLKRKLRTEQIKNRKLRQNNNNLKKRIKRLTEKCKNLKEALVQCKKVENVTENQN